jgi:hypothetical protein
MIDAPQVSEIPDFLLDAAVSRTGRGRKTTAIKAPAYAQGKKRSLVDQALANLREPNADIGDLRAAVEAIPNPDLSWDAFNRYAMAIYAASGGSDEGKACLYILSRKSKKHDDAEIEERWAHFARSPPTEIGFGALVWAAREAVPGWEMPSRRARPAIESTKINGHHGPNIFGGAETKSASPLIELNKKYAMIANVGGKSRVMSWTESAVDARCQEPLFQDSRSFAEFYANQYLTVTKTKHSVRHGPQEYEEDVQLGQWWLKWTGRRSYAGVELAPNEPEVLPNGNYNLWRGWGVTPAEGAWPRMREHIEEILAAGDSQAVKYIMNWTAWGVQHPGELAGAALMIRGDKGAGKGVFFRSVRQMYGSHGKQISNRSHLIGNFNAHQQNCLLLYADEAYWAGDLKGEAILKALITEPTQLIERKGVDAVMMPNRIKLCMSANADWVLPASGDERRYGVFDAVNVRGDKEKYFDALHRELLGGGIGAMLYDLLNMELGDWSPRFIPQTKALQRQKALSMSTLDEWWLALLQGHGENWMEFDKPSDQWGARELMNAIRAASPGLSRISDYKIAEFLGKNGAARARSETGSKWQLPSATDARAAFEAKFGVWKWEEWKGTEK